jgi:hypothetical protein
MPYRIAGIDVHKKMLAVVASDVEIDGEFDFERRIKLVVRILCRMFPCSTPIRTMRWKRY